MCIRLQNYERDYNTGQLMLKLERIFSTHFPKFLMYLNNGGILRVANGDNDFFPRFSSYSFLRSSLAYYSPLRRRPPASCLIREGGTGDYSEPP